MKLQAKFLNDSKVRIVKSMQQFSRNFVILDYT